MFTVPPVTQPAALSAKWPQIITAPEDEDES